MEKKYCSVFERTEKKYLLTKEKYGQILNFSSEFIALDEYGLTTICNIYFDTESDELIRRSIEKPAYKEKLRLRSYGVPSNDDNVFLEIKKKWNSVVYKRRISMKYKEAEDYLYDGISPDSDCQILREIDYFIRFYNPEPKVFLAYDRAAYFGIQDSSLRVTFDSNVRIRTDALHLADGSSGSAMKNLDGMYVMEIKVPGAMPIWMVRMLSELEIYPVSFSKYGNYYMNSKEEENSVYKCN